jgi:hypothetical protein
MSKGLLLWRFPSKSDLAGWVQVRLRPMSDEAVVFVQRGDEKLLRDFSQHCHEIVQDRDVSFTLNHRIKLYERWLSSGQPCLMATMDASKALIGASVVLPLTFDAYRDFSSGQLDALDIESFHIDADDDAKERYLLVDMWAFSPHAFETSPGISLRSLIRHVAKLYNPYKQKAILLCSTGNRPLIKRLMHLEFEKGPKHRGADESVYSANLSNTGQYSEEIRPYYEELRRVIRSYHQQPFEW